MAGFPKVGAVVACPKDRGNAAYTGIITAVGESVGRAFKGAAYVWLTVKHPSGKSEVWPSNRLGFKVE